MVANVKKRMARLGRVLPLTMLLAVVLYVGVNFYWMRTYAAPYDFPSKARLEFGAWDVHGALFYPKYIFFKKIDSMIVTSMPNITSVKLHDNLRLIELRNGQKITELDVPYSYLSLKDFPALKTLTLHGNSKLELSEVPALESLHIPECHEAAIYAEGLRELTLGENCGMSSLLVSGGKLTSFSPPYAPFLTNISGLPYLSEIVLPDTSALDKSLFISQCESLTSVICPGMSELQIQACNGMNNLVLSDGVRNASISQCAGLERLTLPVGCEASVWGCDALEDLIIPEGVQKATVYQCEQLKTLSVPTGTEISLGDHMLDTLILYGGLENLESLPLGTHGQQWETTLRTLYVRDDLVEAFQSRIYDWMWNWSMSTHEIEVLPLSSLAG